MREHGDLAKPIAVIFHIARLCRQDRDDGAEVAGTKPPNMEIGQTVSAAFYYGPQLLRPRLVCAHVQENAAGVADQSIGPIGDDQGANDAHDRIHKYPAKKAPEEQPEYREYRNCRVRRHMNESRAHIVVPHCGGCRAAMRVGLRIMTLKTLTPRHLTMSGTQK